MYIVTVDNGTSSTKTVLWTAEGVPVADAEQAYSLRRPHPLWAEIDGNVWWDAVCSTIQQVISQSGVDPGQVAGVGVDGIGWTLLPVDGECNPLSPAMIWLDRRAEEEAEWLRNLARASDLVDLAANPLDSGIHHAEATVAEEAQPGRLHGRRQIPDSLRVHSGAANRRVHLRLHAGLRLPLFRLTPRALGPRSRRTDRRAAR